MKIKTFRKYITIARKLHKLEMEIFAARHSSKRIEHIKLKRDKLRKRYDKFQQNPKYINLLYKNFWYLRNKY